MNEYNLISPARSVLQITAAAFTARLELQNMNVVRHGWSANWVGIGLQPTVSHDRQKVRLASLRHVDCRGTDCHHVNTSARASTSLSHPLSSATPPFRSLAMVAPLLLIDDLVIIHISTIASLLTRGVVHVTTTLESSPHPVAIFFAVVL